HQGNTGGDRFIFGKILKTVLLCDRLELGLVSGIGTVRKYGALHHLFHYRRHVPLSGNESLDVLLCQLDLRYRDPRRCAGREASENNGHSRNGETKHMVHGGAPHVAHPAAPPQLRQRFISRWPKGGASRYRLLSRCFVSLL